MKRVQANKTSAHQKTDRSKPEERPAPKYIQSIMRNHQKREIENQAAQERLEAAKLKRSGVETEMKFVTSAYKA